MLTRRLTRRLRFGTVVVAVVLSLTGFSRSHHGHTSHGGGCSSSQSHSSSTTHHHYDDDDDYYGSSSGSSSGSTTSRYTPSATPTASARAAVVTCVKKGRTSATVNVTAASGSGTHNYTVTMSFLAADGSYVDGGSADVQVYSGSSATLKVPMDEPSKVSSVTKCVVQSVSLRY
ncbi:hypothetical protein AB0436_22530 [Streptomyces sp. NPDC051322]|uniref:hypothetical protein n=1 Tax=Streptomyces sp. NPDC051322 TaxID=3154645 RepID=UPI00344CE205